MPQPNEIEVVLRHHAACKSKAPSTLSLCIIVPKWHDPRWRPLLKGFRLLRQMFKGGHKADQYDCQIFYDAPEISDSKGVFTHEPGLTWSFIGQIGGQKARVLLDCGGTET